MLRGSALKHQPERGLGVARRVGFRASRHLGAHDRAICRKRIALHGDSHVTLHPINWELFHNHVKEGLPTTRQVATERTPPQIFLRVRERNLDQLTVTTRNARPTAESTRVARLAGMWQAARAT